MRRFVSLFISIVLLSGPTLRAAAQDARRAQVAAATADALGSLERDVLAAPITADLSVEQFIDKTAAHDALAKALRRAEQIGGARWLDDQTCQIRMELPGGEVADALVSIARAHPREAGLPADVLRERVDRIREMTFAATGMSTGATDRLRPPPEQAAWRGVSDAAVCAAVKEARQDAARKVIDSLGSIELSPRGPRLDKTLADAKVRADLETWLMNRPVTSVKFQDDMAVRVTVAVEGEPLWNELLAAAGERDDLGFPRDDQSRSDVRREVLRRGEPTVGRALAKAGGAPQRQAVPIPRDPPRWVVDQVDARGSSKAVNGRLKTARAAEAVARDRLRGRIEALSLSRTLTLGDAAKRDDRVRGAIDRAVERARPRKVNYLSDGGAEVSFSLDLRDLWYELEEQ